MAERRMFTIRIIDSDDFLEMPCTSQLLYFHIGMRADDDGFVNNPRRIMRDARCSDSDMQILIAKGYVIPFQSGIVVIAHWRMHNCIRKDRYKATVFAKERQLLTSDKMGVYELLENADNHLTTTWQPLGNQVTTNGIQMVSKMETQVRLGKVRLGKDSIDVDMESAAVDKTVNKFIDNCQSDKYASCIKMFCDNLQPGAGPIVLEELISLVEDYGEVWVKEAIRVAAKQGGRTVSYMNKILEGWQRNGFKQDSPDYKRKKQSQSSTGNRQVEAALGAIEILRNGGIENVYEAGGSDCKDTSSLLDGVPRLPIG